MCGTKMRGRHDFVVPVVAMEEVCVGEAFSCSHTVWRKPYVHGTYYRLLDFCIIFCTIEGLPILPFVVAMLFTSKRCEPLYRRHLAMYLCRSFFSCFSSPYLACSSPASVEHNCMGRIRGPTESQKNADFGSRTGFRVFQKSGIKHYLGRIKTIF